MKFETKRFNREWMLMDVKWEEEEKLAQRRGGAEAMR
jgi:hypothetical protein